MIDLSVNIAGIRMKNPVMTASGTFGYGQEYFELIEFKMGAIVVKTITRTPRQGNAQPRTNETATGTGMINRIGLQNVGVEIFISDKPPFLRQLEIPVIVSIGGETIEDYQYVIQRLNETIDIVGYEINVSCPNVKDGLAFGQNAKMVADLVVVLRKATNMPLIVKLTPNVTYIAEIARAAVEAGADALSLINTIKAREKIHSGPHKGEWIIGGLSGPCILPIALQKVAEVAETNLGVPIIGMGGIMNVQNALDFIEAGADAIAIGTGTLAWPKTIEEVVNGLEKFMLENGVGNIDELKTKLRGGNEK